MENYSLLMGAAAVMKMAVGMAAVSMEKPSGGTSPSGRVPEQRLLSPRSWLRDGGGSGRFRVPWLLFERDEPHSYRYSPEPRWRTTPPHGSSSGDEDGGGDGSGVDGEAFRGTSPAGCRNRDSCPPDLGFAMAAALEGFAYRLFIMASPSINFNQFLEKEKLKSNGSNFTEWFHHVRIFLNGGNLQYVLEAPLGSPPPPAVSEEEKNVFENRVTRYSQVQCAILCSLEAELQKRFEHHDPCEMIRELKVIFETHAAVESYEASKQFFGCMMEEGSSVSEHVFAMSGHARKLSDLGIVIPNQLGIHRVLQSLPPSYKNFVMNYNMQNMNKEIPELFSMLKSAEVEIQKGHQVLMVNKTTSFKKQGKPKKGNFKKGGKKVAALLKSLRVALNLILTAITAMGRGTGSVIAPSTWLI
ncbi:hypothetical protein QYE76_023323 [Lolium multiflorum]|uniref:Zinc finger, CCHC-type n=1 Tax=Lolium multiflorum TaxID=4521 RepID=A0AAD8RBH3_LOLMU|nr:hypothetical protein QYE76_023323 [Lolium multiflorum]